MRLSVVRVALRLHARFGVFVHVRQREYFKRLLHPCDDFLPFIYLVLGAPALVVTIVEVLRLALLLLRLLLLTTSPRIVGLRALGAVTELPGSFVVVLPATSARAGRSVERSAVVECEEERTRVCTILILVRGRASARACVLRVVGSRSRSIAVTMQVRCLGSVLRSGLVSRCPSG